MNDQARMTNDSAGGTPAALVPASSFVIRHSSFIRHSGFDIRHCVLAAILFTLCALPGCNRGSASSLEEFKEQWYAAVNQRKPEQLYAMLDAKSRRLVDVQLETLRGLPDIDQLAVVNYLGGDRVSNLHEIGNDRYFALWWRKATDDQIPTMAIEAAGDRSAYMVVTLNDKSQRYELKIEGGKWVWALNEQKFQPPAPVKNLPDEAKAN